jgi:hypothetical protein
LSDKGILIEIFG